MRVGRVCGERDAVGRATAHDVACVCAGARRTLRVRQLSVAFKDRLVFAEAEPYAKDKALWENYGIKKDDAPALVVARDADAAPVQYAAQRLPARPRT
jgi:hypothetical protein